MDLKERIKIETQIAVQNLLESKMKKVTEEDKEEEESDEDEYNELDPLEEGLFLGTIVAGATVAAIGTLIKKFKEGARDKLMASVMDKQLPNITSDILRLRQRAKMLNSASDIDSFEAATTKIKNELKTVIKAAPNLSLTEEQIKAASWPIGSVEDRTVRFIKDYVKALELTHSNMEELESIAMQELNTKLGI